MKVFIKITFLIMSIILLTSCKVFKNKDSFIDESKANIKDNSDLEKSQIEIRFSCEEDGISKYIEDGWVIIEKYSEEKICTWKSFPSTKNCDMEKDKGCKITKPDKIGEEIIYLLQR